MDRFGLPGFSSLGPKPWEPAQRAVLASGPYPRHPRHSRLSLVTRKGTECGRDHERLDFSLQSLAGAGFHLILSSTQDLLSLFFPFQN